MRKEIIDINEITDSNEVYSSRPNPFLPGFIYSLAILIIVSILFCVLGKIGITSHASGIVRPNEGISTIAPLVSGKITSVAYEEGKNVNEGDILLTVDTSESELSKAELNTLLAKDKRNLELVLRYLSALDRLLSVKKENGLSLLALYDSTNETDFLFSCEPLSDEYPYHEKLRYLSLSVERAVDNALSSDETELIKINSYREKLTVLSNDLKNLDSCLDSLRFGKNLVNGDSIYEPIYKTYAAANASYDEELSTKLSQLDADRQKEGNNLYIALYKERAEGYRTLVDALCEGTSLDLLNETDELYKGIYSSYLSNVDSYLRTANNTALEKEAFKTQTLASYMQKADECRTKLKELELGNSSFSKEDLLSNLWISYVNAREQEFLVLKSDILASIATIENEQKNARTELSLYGGGVSSQSTSPSNTASGSVITIGSTSSSLSSDNQTRINTLQDIIDSGELKKNGLNQLLLSAEKNEDLITLGEEYKIKYRLYEAKMNNLKDEYESKKKELETDKATEKSNYYKAYYTSQLNSYDQLITLIREGIEDPSSVNTLTLGTENDLTSLMFADFCATCKAYDRKSNEALSSAENYKIKTLNEYLHEADELEAKVRELEITGEGIRPIDELKNELIITYDVAKEKLYNQTLSELMSTKASKETELETTKQNLDLILAGRNSDYLRDIEISLTEQKLSILSEIENLEKSISDEEYRIKQYEEQIRKGVIRAERSGFINTSSLPSCGDLVQAGTPLGTIIPENSGSFKVQLYVANSDIAYIKEGDEVRYNIAALPSSTYGTAIGHVQKVGKDMIINDGQYSGYFLVEATIDSTSMTDQDGNTGTISIGMQLDAKIVTQEKSIMRYLLEKMDLW